ncbi:unnamed protein product, partial [Discosporangium mesarthrocarpum]
EDTLWVGCQEGHKFEVPMSAVWTLQITDVALTALAECGGGGENTDKALAKLDRDASALLGLESWTFSQINAIQAALAKPQFASSADSSSSCDTSGNGSRTGSRAAVNPGERVGVAPGPAPAA